MDVFNADERYTTTALDIDGEVIDALTPIFEKWIAAGVRIRDIAHIATGAVLQMECEQILYSDECRHRAEETKRGN